AATQRLGRDRRVCRRGRQHVDDVGAGLQQFRQRAVDGQLEPPGQRIRLRPIEISDADDVDERDTLERLDVELGDVSGADDAGAQAVAGAVTVGSTDFAVRAHDFPLLSASCFSTTAMTRCRFASQVMVEASSVWRLAWSAVSPFATARSSAARNSSFVRAVAT